VIMRELCEIYPGMNPLVFQQCHLNQIAIMLIDLERLRTGRKIVRGTPSQLRRLGLWPPNT